MNARRILIIGYGAIASELCEALLAETLSTYDVGLLLRSGSPSRKRAPEELTICESIQESAAFGPDLVVEAAGHCAVRESVPELLELGLPVLVSSIGAFHDDKLLARLLKMAVSNGGKLILASGALGALDYMRAVRNAGGLEINYESRKPPKAWRGELKTLNIEADAVEKPLILFKGTAREAAGAYPQNLNVAAAVALAGPGMDQVQVSVVCDPEVSGNTHVLTASSELGNMRIEIANQPSPTNPKTSMIVANSLLAAIRQHFSPLQML